MNIYDARKLQKQLYKRSTVPHKGMMCSMFDGELCYHVISGVSDSNNRTINMDFINAIIPSVETVDMRVVIFYNDGSWRGSPPGMYLAEIIKID